MSNRITFPAVRQSETKQFVIDFVDVFGTVAINATPTLTPLLYSGVDATPGNRFLAPTYSGTKVTFTVTNPLPGVVYDVWITATNGVQTASKGGFIAGLPSQGV